MTERPTPDRGRPPTPPPSLSIPTPDGLLRADLYLSPRTEIGAYGRPIPLYRLVLIRLVDGRAIADTRKTRHEARILSHDPFQLELSVPGDSERFIAINLRASTCGEENFRGPIGPDVPLDQLHSIL